MVQDGISIWESYCLSDRIPFCMGDKVPVQSVDGRGSGGGSEFGEGDLQAFEIRIIKGVVSQDHVHIMVSSLPTLVPSEIMRQLKGRTSSKLFEEFAHTRKRY